MTGTSRAVAAGVFQIHAQPKHPRRIGVISVGGAGRHSNSRACARAGRRLSVALSWWPEMIMEQTEDVMDVDRPDGERIRLKFRGEAARRPEVAAGLVRLLLEAVDGNVYEAVTAYANGFDLAATYFLGTEWVIIEIYERMTLSPLVNASGGSPRSSASRQRIVPVTRPLARLLRLRAPLGR
jgi:hypothetical protein